MRNQFSRQPPITIPTIRQAARGSRGACTIIGAKIVRKSEKGKKNDINFSDFMSDLS
jgi:hypothetical protein